MGLRTIKIDNHEFRVPRVSDADMKTVMQLRQDVMSETGLGGDNDEHATSVDSCFAGLAAITDDRLEAVIDNLTRKSYVKLDNGAFASLAFDQTAELVFGPDLVLPFRLLWATIQLDRGQ